MPTKKPQRESPLPIPGARSTFRREEDHVLRVGLKGG